MGRKKAIQATRAQMNTKTLSLSQVTKWWSWFWDLERILIYWMCLGVKYFALALNVEFRTLVCQWMRWLGGIYSPQPLPSRWQSLLAMVTPDSPVTHRTVIVHCPVRATSARLLGFGAVDRWSPLSFCCTGQSGATSDSSWPLASALWLLRGTIHHCSSEQSTVGTQGVVAPLAHWIVRCTPDSPVNYSGGCPWNSREWLVWFRSGLVHQTLSGAPFFNTL
jgi:hypothetical protein